MPLLLFAVPIVSTLLGGMLAVRLRRSFTLLIALGAGILLGATFLDLLPEAAAIGASAGWSRARIALMSVFAVLFFFALQAGIRAVARRTDASVQPAWLVRRAGASLLVFHSFRDGMAIGAAYAASASAGYAVALGIAAHDVGDGMNTVLLASGGERPTWSTYAFLAADALAPFLGGLLTAWWVLSRRDSVVLLVLAAGFFVQMAIGDFLPEIRQDTAARRWAMPCVVAGAALVYAANLLLRHQL